MRVVLDNNILARAAAGPVGPAGELLDRLGPPHLLILSSVMLQELSEVLYYTGKARSTPFAHSNGVSVQTGRFPAISTIR